MAPTPAGFRVRRAGTPLYAKNGPRRCATAAFTGIIRGRRGLSVPRAVLGQRVQQLATFFAPQTRPRQWTFGHIGPSRGGLLTGRGLRLLGGRSRGRLGLHL